MQWCAAYVSHRIQHGMLRYATTGSLAGVRSIMDQGPAHRVRHDSAHACHDQICTLALSYSDQIYSA